MARTGRKFAIAHGAQFAAQRLLGDHDAEFLVNPLAEVDDPPSYDGMNGRDRTALDDRCQRGSVRIVQPRRLSGRLAIDQAVRPMGVELEHPIANDLKRHTANLRRLGASCTFVNRRQSQKPPCLRAILRSFRGGPDHRRVKIGPKRNGHGEPPLFATLNHFAADSKIPCRVTLSGIWYLAVAVGGRLKGKPCRFYGSDLKIRVADDHIRYPDGLVVCSRVDRTAKVVHDPVVIFEVLSPSTGDMDRIVKAREYQATPSVKLYVMLEQDCIGATVHVPAQDGWKILVLKDDDTLVMPGIGLAIPLAEFYEGLAFEAHPVDDNGNDRPPTASA